MTLLELREYVKFKTLRRSDDIEIEMFASLTYAAMLRVCMKTIPLSLVCDVNVNVLRYDKKASIRRPLYPSDENAELDIDNELCLAVAALVACDIVVPETRGWFKNEAEDIILDYDRNVSTMALEKQNGQSVLQRCSR